MPGLSEETLEAIAEPPAPGLTSQSLFGRRGLSLAALAVALVLPLMVQSFLTFQLTLVLVYAIAIIGLNLLTGFNGQFSLGHSAFYGLGAYTTAILMDKAGIPYAATLPAAGLVCFIFGFLFGLPALRLEGVYLALATFALAIATPQLLKSIGPEACRASASTSPVRRSDCRSTRINGSITSPWRSPW